MIISRTRGNSSVGAQALALISVAHLTDSEVVPYVTSFYSPGSPPSGILRIRNKVDGTGMAFYWYVKFLRSVQ
jgi:hypothetical protein